MSNEPVAWANKDDLDRFDMRVRTNRDNYHSVPLYTHPAPDDTALLRQALEVLSHKPESFDDYLKTHSDVITALRARLEGEQ